MKKSIFLILSLGIQLITLALLATGSGFLLRPFLGTDLPWGNLLTWLLLTLFPTNFLLIRRGTQIHQIPMKVFRICVYVGLILGLLWLPVSRILAGNWSNSFEGGDTNQQLWTYYTFAAAVAPFAGYFLMRLLASFFRAGK